LYRSTVNVNFKNARPSARVSPARQLETRPLLDHIQRYPNVDSLILDCSTYVYLNHVRYLNIASDGGSRITAINEDGRNRIRRLRIHLTPRFVDSPTFDLLVQTLKVPSITELHVSFDEVLLDEDWSYGTTPKVWAVQAWTDLFARLTFAAAVWRSLTVVKVCARVALQPGELAKWNLWVSFE
jgi:hypothetical protein